MNEAAIPSDVASQIATVLDDSLDVPIARVVEMELALRNSPSDLDLRRIYRDWLLEHGCTRRARQVEQSLTEEPPPEYTGSVRPSGTYSWAGL